MEFNIYIKDKEYYKQLVLTPPTNADWKYFKSLKIQVEEQLNIIREDILSYFDDKENVNLIFPKHEDRKIQEKIDKLVEIRGVNTKMKESLIQLLAQTEFILCECGGRMFKTPIGVPYQRYGDNIVLKEVGLHERIRYIFMCEKCVMAVSEEIHYEIQRNIDLKQELLDAGESFVPNKFGFWYWANNKKKTKPACIGNDEIHSVRRHFEYINIPTQRSPFIKITEEDVVTGEIRNIQ